MDDILKNNNVKDIPTLIDFIKNIKNHIDTYMNLPGISKKELIIKYVKQIIDVSNVTGFFEPIILLSIDKILNKLLIIDINGDLRLNTLWFDNLKLFFKKIIERMRQRRKERQERKLKEKLEKELEKEQKRIEKEREKEQKRIEKEREKEQKRIEKEQKKLKKEQKRIEKEQKKLNYT